jgi:transcriptional regulator with XRE-family HTH domain
LKYRVLAKIAYSIFLLVVTVTQKTIGVVEPQPEVGSLIRELRQHGGLTQEKFAAKLRVRFPTVNGWKNNGGILSSVAREKIEPLAKVAFTPLTPPLSRGETNSFPLLRGGLGWGALYLCKRPIEGMLRVITHPSVSWCQLANGLVSNYFPQEEYRQ